MTMYKEGFRKKESILGKSSKKLNFLISVGGMGQEESDQNLGPFLSKKTSYKISAQFVEKWLPSAKLQFGLRSELDNEFRGPNRPHQHLHLSSWVRVIIKPSLRLS